MKKKILLLLAFIFNAALVTSLIHSFRFGNDTALMDTKDKPDNLNSASIQNLRTPQPVSQSHSAASTSLDSSIKNQATPPLENLDTSKNNTSNIDKLQNYADELVFLPTTPKRKGNPQIPTDSEVHEQIESMLQHPYAKNKILLSYNDYAALHNVSSLHADYDIRIDNFFYTEPDPTVVIANISPESSVEETLFALLKSGLVHYAEPDYVVSIDTSEENGFAYNVSNNTATFHSLDASIAYTSADSVVVTATPNDASYSNLWGMNQIQAPAAWDTRTDASNVIVAVIDTGIDADHVDLAANMWVNSGETPNNGIDDDGNGYIDDINGWDFANNDNNPDDDNSHGTHCAGTVGAVGNNSIGVAGVAWQVQLMSLKFLRASGSGSTSDAVNCVYYAVNNGADILSNSWGGGGYSSSLATAINFARNNSVIFVAAAGNSNVNNDYNPHYPSSYTYDNIVSVGSSTSSNQKSSFSNYGTSSVDIFAPGSSIYSTTPGNNYGYKSGTSMATPMISGALALIKAELPTMNWKTLLERLYLTDKAPFPLRPYAKYGLINLRHALTQDLHLNSQDIILRNRYTGALNYYFMNNTLITARNAGIIGTGPNWEIAGIKDFNADNELDFVVWNKNTGKTRVWTLDDASVVDSLPTSKQKAVSWRLAAIDDFNTDGNPDLVYHHSITGNVVVWYFNGLTYQGSSGPILNYNTGALKIEASGDFDGNGIADLVLRNKINGKITIKYMQYNGGTLSFLSNGQAGSKGLAYDIKMCGDYNGDMQLDLVFQHKNTGAIQYWYMNGHTRLSAYTPYNIDPSWKIMRD